MKRTFRQFLTITAIISTALFSCKKDKAERPKDGLYGEWHDQTSTGHLTRLIFGKEDNFQYVITTKDPVSTTTVLIGKYYEKGDSLKVRINEKLFLEPNKSTVKSEFTDELFEQATYSIQGNVLTLKYITFPADAPVPATFKFTKALSFGNDVINK